MIHIKTTPTVAAPAVPPGARRRTDLAGRPSRSGRSGRPGTTGRTAARAVLGLALTWSLGLGAGLAGGPAQAQDGPQPRLDTVALTAGMHRITAEVARTPMQQALGLMHRREMGANDGMLFIYDSPHRLCFWMRNTVLPLTIAFIDDDGRIVNLRDMQPLDESSHCADRPVRYALEMHQGWFARRGLKAGFRLRGAPFQP